MRRADTSETTSKWASGPVEGGPSANQAARGDALSRWLATVPGGLVLVLAFRALYLLRFGGDPGWMNLNFLLEAKAMRFGNAVELRMPLLRILLFGLRDSGGGGALSLAAIYLFAHVLLAIGIFYLGRAVLGKGPRIRAALAIAVAIVPLFATDSGYRNISCTLGAGLFAALAALLVLPRSRLMVLRFGAALGLAAAAASCRPESALCVAGLTAALAIAGRRVGTGRWGAATAAVGLLIGIVLAELSNRTLAITRGSAGVVWGASYSFYAFYNSSPLLLRIVSSLRHPGSTATEYLRYLASVSLFGGFAENHGSILRALTSHPGKAALWLAVKPFDLPATILLPDSLTPLVVVPYAATVVRFRREGFRKASQSLAPLWLAFAAPFIFDLEWTQALHAPYLLFLAPFLLLLAIWGIEPWLDRASATNLRTLSLVSVVAAGLFVGLAGSRDRSTSPALRSATDWLQQQCAATGCLVNALPQSMEAQGWADFQAGAPLPPKDKRAEDFVRGRYPEGYQESVRWSNRLAKARDNGWLGPVLYVRPMTSLLKCFSDDFDPEHRLEGSPNLDGAPSVARFGDESDRVDIFDLRQRSTAK
jgi:hypothetical protein